MDERTPSPRLDVEDFSDVERDVENATVDAKVVEEGCLVSVEEAREDGPAILVRQIPVALLRVLPGPPQVSPLGRR